MAQTKIDKKIFHDIRDYTVTGSLVMSGINVSKTFSLFLFYSYFLLLFLAFWFINDIKENDGLFFQNNNGVITYTLDKEAPNFTWIFSPHDISQEYYMIKPTIDDNTQAIVIKSGIVTDFCLLSIEPDQKTNNTIIYSSKNKIDGIGKKGLSFYSKFPDYQNKQAIRIFVLTALLSLLIHECLKIVTGIFQSYKSNESYNNNINHTEKKIPS